jgi:hypothetical protein
MVELRTYQHAGHFDIPEVASPDVLAWIGERLAGRPARSICQRRGAWVRCCSPQGQAAAAKKQARQVRGLPYPVGAPGSGHDDLLKGVAGEVGQLAVLPLRLAVISPLRSSTRRTGARAGHRPHPTKPQPVHDLPRTLRGWARRNWQISASTSAATLVAEGFGRHDRRSSPAGRGPDGGVVAIR